MKETIEAFESRLEQDLSELRSLVPPGYRAHVQLLEAGRKGRKKRKDAAADSWTPESGEVRIYFEPDKASPKQQIAVPAQASPCTTEPGSLRADPVSDIVRSLNRAESRPGFDFIALKWFRDFFLPGERFEWASSDSARQSVLRQAIERRLILTSKVPNPKSPSFPVTAIRLNQQHPDVRRMLTGGEASDAEFKPVEIRGASLSATILRERR
jgi:hypothetical protein